MTVVFVLFFKQKLLVCMTGLRKMGAEVCAARVWLPKYVLLQVARAWAVSSGRVGRHDSQNRLGGGCASPFNPPWLPAKLVEAQRFWGQCRSAGGFGDRHCHPAFGVFRVGTCHSC